ncbi:uncharacterized protein LOC143609948 [Bidens hawaiensis]|uniref:uncharacterized protein LOC143609948 n=1 Tax=Bidens hawaiensis TaxID=980011 RepID=UPI0040499EA7
MGPLVKVLKLVDNEKKPAMVYVHEAMERAKLAISSALGENSNEYSIVSKILTKGGTINFTIPCTRWVTTSTHGLTKSVFFGLEAAKRQHGKIAPAEWWKLYGKRTRNLQQLAIRVLSLTCSASGCERNWSTFKHYNYMIKNRCDSDVVNDAISSNGIDHSNEWLIGKMDDDQVFNDEGDFDMESSRRCKWSGRG